MHKLRRIFSAILILCCVLTLSTPAFAHKYTDVSGLSTQFRDAINYLYDNDLMKGTSTTQFSPNQSVTRSMIATLLYRLSGDTGSYPCDFPDVPSGSYYKNAVGWGVDKGIIAGHTDGNFHPHDPVKFQELCTFFYRYAEEYNYETAWDSEDITDASDYANISAYAVDAMSWFYSWGLKDRASKTAALNPKETVTRKYAALYLHRYRLNVEGIVFGRDNFRFINSASNFFSKTHNRYCMSTSDWDNLCSYVRDVQGLDGWKKFLEFDQGKFENGKVIIPPKEWVGACYGMSLVTILDYLGRINLEGNCTNGATSIYDIPVFRDVNNPLHRRVLDRHFQDQYISKVESKVNMYQRAYTPLSSQQWSTYPDSSIAVNHSLRELVSSLAHGGLGLFVFSFEDYDDKSNLNTYSHTIVVYGKSEKIGDTYYVKTYDPNNDTPGEISIDASSLLWTGEVSSSTRVYGISGIIGCKFENDFEILNSLDYDSESNVTSVLPSPAVLDTQNVICVQGSSSFTVINSEGESLHYNHGDITGDMDVFGTDFIASSPDSPCELLFLVDSSDGYTCTSDSEGTIQSFFVISQDNCVGTRTGSNGDGWSRISVSAGPELANVLEGGSYETY